MTQFEQAGSLDRWVEHHAVRDGVGMVVSLGQCLPGVFKQTTAQGVILLASAAATAAAFASLACRMEADNPARAWSRAT